MTHSAQQQHVTEPAVAGALRREHREVIGCQRAIAHDVPLGQPWTANGKPNNMFAGREDGQTATWHVSATGASAIRDAGAHLLFLPPYSPDLNPIEMVFAKFKTLLRKADERSIAAVWRRSGSLLQEFSPSECANCVRHAGYEQT